MLIGTGVLLLMITVFISGCAADEAGTGPTLNHQVTNTGTLAEPGKPSDDGRSDLDSREASSPVETIRNQLIRLLTINSLLTTHVAVLPR